MITQVAGADEADGFLINTSRGGLITTRSVPGAEGKNGRRRRLDVFEEEPPPATTRSSLWTTRCSRPHRRVDFKSRDDMALSAAQGDRDLTGEMAQGKGRDPKCVQNSSGSRGPLSAWPARPKAASCHWSSGE